MIISLVFLMFKFCALIISEEFYQSHIICIFYHCTAVLICMQCEQQKWEETTLWYPSVSADDRWLSFMNVNILLHLCPYYPASLSIGQYKSRWKNSKHDMHTKDDRVSSGLWTWFRSVTGASLTPLFTLYENGKASIWPLAQTLSEIK